MQAYQSFLKPGCFDGKRILISGGGSGIGRCTAHELASLGAQVIICGRTEDKLKQVTQEILEDGGQCQYQVLDIRDEDAVVDSIKTLVHTAPIDGLFNNAGGQFPSPLAKINKKGFEAVSQTNLTGTFLMSREVYLQSMAEHGGSIVNMLADNANGMPGMGHSGAARAGVENLTKTAAWEWGHQGVRVNAIAPGWVASSGFDTYDPAFGHVIKRMKEQVPLKRLATESEISAVICFLLSPAANFVSGACIKIDGGSSLGSAPAIWPLPKGEANNSDSINGFHRYQTPKILQES